MENQKSSKIIKAELLGFLGNLQEKQKYCSNVNNIKGFVAVFNSLFKDPDYTDASKVCEAEVISAMLEHEQCPEEIVSAVLKMKNFPGKSYVYQSKFISGKQLNTVLKATINKINLQKNGHNDLTQELFNTLVAICKNPNLSRTDRLTLEKFCDALSRQYDDSLVAYCVLYTKRATWLCEKFATFVQRGGNNLTVLMNMIQNPLAKVHMLEYAAKNVMHMPMVEVLVRHPNISVSALESLKYRFPRMEDFILKRISQLNDEFED